MSRPVRREQEADGPSPQFPLTNPRLRFPRQLLLFGLAALLTFVVSVAPARADIIDLTKAGSFGVANGGIYVQTDPQPTGTGNLDPFVRIQMTGTERGYNTDARPVEFDTKDQNQWTHSLNLSSLTPETINGTSYYKFLLDINEIGNDAGSLLSLNDVKVYLGDSASLTGYNDGFGVHSVGVYDLDSASTDNTVELNYKLNHGSGSGDMFLYIPTANFQGFGSQFQWVYLYSAFGNPNQSDAGFEEWAASVSPPQPPTAVPAPPGAIMAGLGIGCCLLGVRRRKLVAAA